jgi:hypothetical protein
MTREEFMDIVYSELHSDGDNCRANRIIDAADEYAEEQTKWISVNERLPKYNTPVLLALKQIGKERAIVIGERRTRKSGWYFVDIAAYDTEHEVIAWMPLPEPYKASPTEVESVMQDD